MAARTDPKITDVVKKYIDELERIESTYWKPLYLALMPEERRTTRVT